MSVACPIAGARRDDVAGVRFLDAAHEGGLIEGSGEITRASGSLIFLRGMLTCGERMLFAFSGTITRVKMRMPTAAESNG